MFVSVSTCRFPQGLEDVSKYPALIGELLRRHWSEADLAGVLRLNFLRVFEKVEKVREGFHLNLMTYTCSHLLSLVLHRWAESGVSEHKHHQVFISSGSAGGIGHSVYSIWKFIAIECKQKCIYELETEDLIHWQKIHITWSPPNSFVHTYTP